MEMTMYMNAKDESEIIEALREFGYPETDIEMVVDGVKTKDIELAWVADFIQAMEEGDDDEAFACACAIGIA